MINFMELVDKVEQRNKQNRAAAMAAIQPYFDAMYKKSVYEQEQAKQASEAIEYGGQMSNVWGMPFTPVMHGDKPAGASIQFRAMEQQFEAGKTEQIVKEFAKKQGIDKAEIPRGIYARYEWYKGKKEEVEKEKKSELALEDLIAAYPETQDALKDKETLPASQRYAIVSRAVEEKKQAEKRQQEMSTWLTKSNITAEETREKEDRKAEAAANKPPTQAQQNNINKVNAYNGNGVMYKGHRVQRRELKSGEASFLAAIRDSDHYSHIRYKDGKLWGLRKAKSKKEKDQWYVLTPTENKNEYNTITHKEEKVVFDAAILTGAIADYEAAERGVPAEHVAKKQQPKSKQAKIKEETSKSEADRFFESMGIFLGD